MAELAKGRLRKKIPELREALQGRFRDHHALLIRLCLEHTAHLEAAIAELDERVEAVMAPFAEARDHLDTITGVGKRAAECIIAEIGVDMGVFPTAGHLSSWAGMAPGNNITGGKRHSGKTNNGNVWLADMLNQCAWSAARSRDTYLSAQFWRLARRIGKKKAAVAVGHSILVICWHLLANNADYDDLGGDYFARRGNTDRHQDRLVGLHPQGAERQDQQGQAEAMVSSQEGQPVEGQGPHFGAGELRVGGARVVQRGAAAPRERPRAG